MSAEADVGNIEIQFRLRPKADIAPHRPQAFIRASMRNQLSFSIVGLSITALDGLVLEEGQMLEGLGTVVTQFNDLGWLANAMGIGIPSVSASVYLWKKRNQYWGASTFQELNQEMEGLKLDANLVKAIARIAIVDDHLSDFPVSELRKAGYTIETYKQITLSDMPTLAKFDMVFLDIRGIVKTDIEEGGLKVISRLRELSPHQKVCAVSNQKFSPEANQFFNLADEVKNKPIGSHDCEEVINTLCKEKFDPYELAQSLDQVFAPLSKRARRQALVQLRRNAERNSTELGVVELEKSLGKLEQPAKGLLNDFFRVFRYGTA